MTNTIIRAGDRVVVPVEATIRYASPHRPFADLTLHLPKEFGTYDEAGKYVLLGDIHVGAYPIGNATKVVPPVKVGDRLTANASPLPYRTVIVNDVGGYVAQVNHAGNVDILHGERDCRWAHFVAVWGGRSTIAFVPEATR